LRIVSLTCSNTEIVCALGCADQLVGIDNHSDYPAKVVDRLSRVGPDLTIDIQKVADLKPNLVLASLTVPGHELVVEGIESRGLPYIAPEPESLEDVYENILAIGELLGASRQAEQTVLQMKQAIQPVGFQQDKPSVLIQWWPKPVIAPGKLSWTEDLIDAAGLKNVIAERNVKSTPLSDEEVLELDPECAVISWCGVKFEKYRTDVVYRNPMWRNTRFVRNKKVFAISEAHLGRPSPRLIEGFEELKNVRFNILSSIT